MTVKFDDLQILSQFKGKLHTKLAGDESQLKVFRPFGHPNIAFDLIKANAFHELMEMSRTVGAFEATSANTFFNPLEVRAKDSIKKRKLQMMMENLQVLQGSLF